MKKPEEIDDAQAIELAQRIIQLLNGLSVGQAKWVLRETGEIIDSNTVVDIESPCCIPAFGKPETPSVE